MEYIFWGDKYRCCICGCDMDHQEYACDECGDNYDEDPDYDYIEAEGLDE